MERSKLGKSHLSGLYKERETREPHGGLQASLSQSAQREALAALCSPTEGARPPKLASFLELTQGTTHPIQH